MLWHLVACTTYVHPDPVYFIRNLVFGEGFRFLNFSILKPLPSLIHRNPFLNFQSSRIQCLRENLSNQCFNQFFRFGFLVSFKTLPILITILRFDHLPEKIELFASRHLFRLVETLETLETLDEPNATKQKVLSFQEIGQKRKMVIKIEFTPLSLQNVSLEQGFFKKCKPKSNKVLQQTNKQTNNNRGRGQVEKGRFAALFLENRPRKNRLFLLFRRLLLFFEGHFRVEIYKLEQNRADQLFYR